LFVLKIKCRSKLNAEIVYYKISEERIKYFLIIMQNLNTFGRSRISIINLSTREKNL